MYIISGMHRSGTSLVARLFYEVGADLGNTEDFYPADQWNADGYYEQLSIHAVNSALVHGHWWKFAYFWLPSTKTVMKRAEKFVSQIYQSSVEYKDKVVKDPRFCLTLPAWVKYGMQMDKILFCLREPIQVARSLRTRNFATTNHGLKLWYLHNQRLLENLENSQGVSVWFVSYQNILHEQSFVREMQAAYQFFGYRFTADELKAIYKNYVKRAMNHNGQEKTPSYPREIEALWKELLERHASQFKK